MAKKLSRPYQKFIYWMEEEKESLLRDELASRNIRLPSGKGIVCAFLDPINRIGSVAPEVWSETCRRQGSWYRTSEKNGLYLVISSFPLVGHEERLEAVITESDFQPPKLACQEDKQTLLQDTQLRDRLPEEWKRPGDVEKRIYLRWAKRLGSTVETFEELYVSHTANHANFISPHFAMKENNRPIPYSIDRSAHLCSSCVELFNVLGDAFPIKLVAPCPGAVIFARLAPDRYLLVEKP
jgi:hypothetical protein